MAHILLTGATGVAGSAVLSHLLSLPTTTISKITLLTRRPPTTAISVITSNDTDKAKTEDVANRLETIIHKDFTTYPDSILEKLTDVKGVIWALGISSNGMKEADYEKITVGYPISFVEALMRARQQRLQSLQQDQDENKASGTVNFVYVSGEGAEMSEKTMTMFGRIKGRAESRLLALQNERYHAVSEGGLRVFNVRPAAIDPGNQWLADHSKLFKDRLGDWVLFPLLKGLYPGVHIKTQDLSRVLVDLAVGDGEALVGEGVEAEGRLVRNRGIRRLAGL